MFKTLVATVISGLYKLGEIMCYNNIYLQQQTQISNSEIIYLGTIHN